MEPHCCLSNSPFSEMEFSTSLCNCYRTRKPFVLKYLPLTCTTNHYPKMTRCHLLASWMKSDVKINAGLLLNMIAFSFYFFFSSQFCPSTICSLGSLEPSFLGPKIVSFSTYRSDAVALGHDNKQVVSMWLSFRCV